MAGTQRRDPVLVARFVACLAAGLLAAVIVLTVPAIASAQPIEAPKAGATVAGPTRVVVNIERGRVYARLNGERVQRHFLRTSVTQRAARVGAAEGLKPGRNVLRVRRETPRATKRARVVFRVRADGKLAGIAARGEHAAGAPLQLRAYGERRRAWCLLDAPRKSELEASPCPRSQPRGSIHPADARSATAKATGIDDLHARRTTFTPDVPGYYRVALGSGTGPDATRDVYTVTAGQSTPLVPIDIPSSVASSDDGAIRVDGVPYPPDRYADHNVQLQILVLDRLTLELTSNTTYNCDDAPNTPCDTSVASDVTKDLSGLGDDSLVIVSEQDYMCDDTSVCIGSATLNALKPIGFDPSVPFPAPAPGQTGGGTALAIVGIPKLTPGQAWALRDYAATDFGATADLSGALVRDQVTPTARYYRPVTTEYSELVVRSSPDSSSACTPQPCGTTATENTMQIGSTPQTDALPAGAQGGFQLVLLDGLTGEVRGHEVAVTNPWQASTVQQAEKSISSQISPGDPGVVLVASIGSPVDSPTSIPADWNTLAGFIEAHGGTKHGVLSMQAGETYAMAGDTNSGAAAGFEAGTAAITPPGVTASPALAGELKRDDDDWRFSPMVGRVDEPAVGIQQALYQPATTWPHSGIPGYAQALSDIGNATNVGPSKQDVALGDDPRAAYWTQDLTADQWHSKSTLIPDVPYPTDSPPYSETDFEALRGDLAQETGWLSTTKSFLVEQLATPSEKGVFSGWEDVQTISDDIKSGINFPNSRNPGFSATMKVIVSELESAITAIDPEVAAGMSAVNQLMDLATAIQSDTTSDARLGDAFQTSVNDYGGDVVGRLEAMANSYETMVEIVAADHGKLERFGRCADTSTCGPGWDWTTDLAPEAPVTLQLWGRQQAWQALLPQKIGATAWFGQYPPGSESGGDATSFECVWTDQYQEDHKYHPFGGLPPGAQYQLLSAMGADGPHHDLWALASWEGNGAGDRAYDATLPAASIVNTLFGTQVLSGDPFTGPVGLVPAHFLLRAYPQPFDAYAHYPPKSFQCGWGLL